MRGCVSIEKVEVYDADARIRVLGVCMRVCVYERECVYVCMYLCVCVCVCVCWEDYSGVESAPPAPDPQPHFLGWCVREIDRVCVRESVCEFVCE